MDTGNNVYFKDGNYFWGNDPFDKEEPQKDKLIPIDKVVMRELCDSWIGGDIMFAERDGKKGVLTILHGNPNGGIMFSSNIYPFLYDEMLLNGSGLGHGIGYVAVRINHCWGILRVEGVIVHGKRAKRKCIMIIPCAYTKKEAIAQIKSKDYHPEFGWKDPFAEDYGFKY